MDGQKESKGRKRENWAFEEEMMLSLGGEFSLHRPLPWGPRMEEIDAKGERFCQEQSGRHWVISRPVQNTSHSRARIHSASVTWL